VSSGGPLLTGASVRGGLRMRETGGCRSSYENVSNRYAQLPLNYSHSIVLGGLVEIS
jgi:hypothetical protein